MKFSPLLLFASLALNAAVVTFIFLRPGAETNAPAETPAAVNPDGKALPVISPEAVQTAQLAKVWAQLQSGDLRSLVAQLRAAGFSASMIRTIISVQVSEQFSARRNALFPSHEDIPFWKSPARTPPDAKTMAALRELEKEQSALMKELLGPDILTNSDDMKFYLRRQYGDLPREKIEQLQNIARDYGELTQDIYTKANGILLAEDRAKIAFLEKERLADIAKTLTPQEFEDYQLRSSDTANMLRWQLSTFNATEDEFRAIYRASAAVETQMGSGRNDMSPAGIRKRQEAILAQVQNSIPPQRLAELKIAIDPEYQQINGLVASLNLPASTSQQVVSVQKDIQQRVAAVVSNKTLPAEERTQQLAALAEEATTKLTTSLGTRGLEAYKQSAGFWLQNLQPKLAQPAEGDN